MSRNIIRSNNTIVAAQNSTTAFSTSNKNLKYHKLAQTFDYSIGYSRQRSKQIGSQDLSTDDIYNQPDVSLNISYIPEPSLSNEVQGRFLNATPEDEFKNIFDSSDTEDSTNFYILVSENQEDSFVDSIPFDTLADLDGNDSIAFGNCFPESYNLSYAVGTLPIVNTSYICSNVVFDHLTGASMEMPCINLTGGNNDNVGRCLFGFVKDLSTANLEKSPPIVNPTNAGSDVTLQNLQVGGQQISGKHLVQSVNMSVSIPRVSAYGLGNDYAFGRNRQFPANGSFSVSSQVSGFESGAMTGVLDSDQLYQFDLTLEASGKTMIYRIEDAKLTSYNYSMDINGRMNFDASYTFEVTQEKGLKLSGTAY
tara:strand:+ start:822 stop:1919 length:1098 start_codon:yes stop_codon:yes gene_type:complete